MSSWLSAEIEANARDRTELQLETASDTVLTPAASTAIADAGTWIVVSAEAAWDGHTGLQLEWTGSSWQAGREPSPSFLSAEAAPWGLQALVSATFHHKAAAITRIGSAAATLAIALTGYPMTGWGVAEPVTEAWDELALTEFVSRRMPESSEVLVTGVDGRSVGASMVTRTSQGISEDVTLYASISTEQGRNDVHLALTAAAANLPMAFGIGYTQPGRTDLMVAPRLRHAPEPAAVAFGPRAVMALGADALQGAPIAAPTLVGRPRLPGMSFVLGHNNCTGWDDLGALISYLGIDRIRAAAPDLLRYQAHAASRCEGTFDGA